MRESETNEVRNHRLNVVDGPTISAGSIEYFTEGQQDALKISNERIESIRDESGSLTGRMTSPKPSMDFRASAHGSISYSGMNIGRTKRRGTTSPFVPNPSATCSITDGFDGGFRMSIGLFPDVPFEGDGGDAVLVGKAVLTMGGGVDC